VHPPTFLVFVVGLSTKNLPLFFHPPGGPLFTFLHLRVDEKHVPSPSCAVIFFFIRPHGLRRQLLVLAIAVQGVRVFLLFFPQTHGRFQLQGPPPTSNMSSFIRVFLFVWTPLPGVCPFFTVAERLFPFGPDIFVRHHPPTAPVPPPQVPFPVTFPRCRLLCPFFFPRPGGS